MSTTTSNLGLFKYTEADHDKAFDYKEALNQNWDIIDETLEDVSEIKNLDKHALKGYLDEGELLTDAEGLADVTSYAHSTFDVSKFTKVGSPSITDDGIARGFSNSNYLTIPIIDYSKPFDIYIRVRKDQIGDGYSRPIGFNGANDSANMICFQGLSNNKWRLAFIMLGGAIDIKTPYVITPGEYYDFHCYWTGTKYGFEYKSATDDTYTLAGEVSNSTAFVLSSSTISLGWVTPSASQGLYLDFKHFSIINNGVPVFNGNKTGTDTYTINNSTVSVPYTLSKTGSKIVDSAYRSRVANVYEYLGYAPYYTLSDTDFTLPMGEIYGLTNKEIEDTKEIIENKSFVAGYLNEGYEIANKKEIELVNKYAHSTFDLSKFTVVGSPTITDDGIASGFTTSNYITKTIPLDTKWKIIFRNKYITSSTAQTPLSIINSANNRVIMRLWNRANSTDCQIVPYRDNNTFTAISFSCIDNHEYEYIVWNDGTNINYQVKDLTNNSIVVENVQSLGDYSIGSITAKIFIGVNGSYGEPFSGSIDLKQFSITVDGVEVFSGNKTGIDTIKPDDYTIVGSPTISDDGIVSGFAGNGFIRTADTINFSSTFELYVKINTGTIISSNKNIIATNSVQGIIIITGNGKLRIQLGDGTQWITNVLVASGTVSSNTDYLIKLTYDGTEYALYVLENGTWTKQISYPSVTQFLPSGYAINIGGNRGGTGEFEGSIDLNAFKIYVDGDLVYQPCLKIPYTLSKTGSKIVEGVYRDRVNDMYEQFGYADYFIQDENYVIKPLGEVYGLINSKDDEVLQEVENTYVPKTITINGKALSSNISLTPSDIGAAASSHNQASNTINAMTGYSKPSSTSAIAATDSLNTAIGKLEKAIDGKQGSGSYVDISSNQTISGSKTFTETVHVQRGDKYMMNMKCTANSGSFINFFKNTSTLTGGLGVTKDGRPAFCKNDDASYANIVTNSTLSTAVGSIAQPVYITADGTATVCNMRYQPINDHSGSISIGGAVSIAMDLTNSIKFVTVTAAVTSITFTGLSDIAYSTNTFELFVNMGSTAYTVAWLNGTTGTDIEWVEGTAPSFPASTTTLIALRRIRWNTAVKWLGNVQMQWS